MDAFSQFPEFDNTIWSSRGEYEAFVYKNACIACSKSKSESIVGEFNIDGLSPSQIIKLQSDLGFEFFEYNNSFFHADNFTDYITVAFEDFRPIGFVRDMLLGKALEASIQYLRLAINNLNKDLIVVSVAEYQFSIQFYDSLVFVDVICKPEMLYEIIEDIDKYLSQEVIDRLTDKALIEPKVFIGYNEVDQKVSVEVSSAHFINISDI